MLRWTSATLTPEVVAIKVDVDTVHLKDRFSGDQARRPHEPTLAPADDLA